MGKMGRSKKTPESRNASGHNSLVICITIVLTHVWCNVVTWESVTAVMRPRDKCGECLVKGRIHYGVTVDISSLMSRHNMNNTLIIYWYHNRPTTQLFRQHPKAQTFTSLRLLLKIHPNLYNWTLLTRILQRLMIQRQPHFRHYSLFLQPALVHGMPSRCYAGVGVLTRVHV